MSQANVGRFDREAAVREQRGLGLAAMGLVNRHGGRFVVAGAIARDRSGNYEVWTDADGRARCSCGEFTARALADAVFQCEHILAVKHAAKAPTVGPRRPAAPLPAGAVEAATAGFARPDHSSDNASPERRVNSPRLFLGDPCARSFGELVTPRQLALIRQLARQTSIDSDDECRELLDCTTGDLSKAAASAFIEYLLADPRHTGESRMRLAS